MLTFFLRGFSFFWLDGKESGDYGQLLIVCVISVKFGVKTMLKRA